MALRLNTTASNNTAVGYQAGYNNTSGSNTQIGYKASFANTTGGGQVSVGYLALTANTTGDFNTALGASALTAHTTGSQNTALGYQAGLQLTTGSNNTFLGCYAGYDTTTGSNNVLIGFNTRGASNNGTNEIVINTVNATSGKGGSTGFINPNGGACYQGNNSAAWSVASDQRLKKNIVDHTEGLDKVVQIRVRNFEYRLPEEVTELPANQAVLKEGVQLGVIAQELQQVLPDCVKTETTGVMSVNQDNITWHMVNAIKDLKAELDTVKAELAALRG
jgi:hypothetical protein